MMKFDVEGRVQDYTFILSLRNHDHLGQIRNFDPNDVVSKINMNGANELSFTVYKYNEAESAKFIEKGIPEEDALERTKEPLWDEITDFKFVYVKELDEYYEIVVENNDEETEYKTVTATSACEVELSQSYLYGLEINTEADINRVDYVAPTVFYNPDNEEASLLNRVLYKLPQYSIKYVDTSLMNIQRTFSVDGTDVYSFLTGEVAEEIGCLFDFDSVDRSISVYDLKTYCVDCGHRDEFSDVCPECGSTSLKYYGEDTTIYVDSENLAESVNLTVDTESVKNCFKLEAGDDNMTAAIRNLNPNGSDYIYYFSEEQKHDMPDELVEKLESYDALVKSHEEEYEKVMADMYEAIDKVIYYTSGMMPTQKEDPTNAALEAAKLTEEEMSPMAVSTVTSSTSTATVNAALKSYAKIFVKSGYFKVDINEGEFSYEGTDQNGNGYGYWYGNFKITNYSDEEDEAISETIRVEVLSSKGAFDTFMEQKIKKKLALDSEEDGNIFDVLSIKDLTKFKEALTYYGLNRLMSFYDSVQGCLDIMIEMDQGNENADLYVTMYTPYYEKLEACQDEIDNRQKTIDEWNLVLDAAEQRKFEIQKALNFEAYLGEELYKVFCMYKREDKYSNENYISDGLENDEIFTNARQFINVAKSELVKSGEHQRAISTTLANLLCMKEFDPIKDKFKVGNFIRVRIDGKVYRLRLVSYQISFGNIQNIDVEFSDVTKIKSGTSDLQSILSKASSMASSYGSVAYQVEKSKTETDKVSQWFSKGLDATSVKIVNNADNQNITIGDSGLLARRKDDFTEKYENYQVKLIANGLYTTSNAWRSVDTAIGKSYMVNPSTGELEEVFGVNAKNIVGELILGSKLGIYSSDASSEMTFDNFGLVLNSKDNGTGQYKRILDIQKDGVSQLYIDTDGNIVLATDQMVQVVESVDRINAKYADIENLYVTNATIENLLAKYATIERLEAVDAKIQNLDVSKLEADFAEIKKLIATDAEIEDLKAGDVTITGKLEATEAEIDTIKATHVQIGSLEAYKATIENLNATMANIEELKAKYIDVLKIEADLAKIAQLEAAIAKIETLETTLAKVETLVSKTIITDDIQANQATIDSLTANLANINKAVIDIAEIEDLQAVNAQIDNLNAQYIDAVQINVDTLNAKSATIEQLVAYTLKSEFGEFKKLTVDELNAAYADIGKLDANFANINSILAGNIGTGLLQTIHLTADNVVIDDAVIKSANIESIDTDIVTIGNDNIVLSGSTQQFKDKDGNVRVQIGLDNEGDFSAIICDENGATIITANGVTENAIPDGLIVDKMVADNANIESNKIKYIDKNGNTTLQTHLEVEQGRIDTLIKETTIENQDGTTISLKDAYYETIETIDGYNTTIAKVNTDVRNLTGEVVDMESRIAEIKATADGISSKVSSIDMTNRNYIRNSKTMIFATYNFVNNPQDEFVADELSYLTDEDGNMLIY